MTPRLTFPAAVLALFAAVVLAACGGGGSGDEDVRPGNLTNPRDVPTVTPWAVSPTPVIIDPNAIQPLPPVGPAPDPDGNDGDGEPPPSSAAGTCAAKYTVVSGDSPSVIADKCGVTTQQILDANPGLDPRNLHPGDILNIPGQ
jgi:hypothetical protein